MYGLREDILEREPREEDGDSGKDEKEIAGPRVPDRPSRRIIGDLDKVVSDPEVYRFYIAVGFQRRCIEGDRSFSPSGVDG